MLISALITDPKSGITGILVSNNLYALLCYKTSGNQDEIFINVIANNLESASEISGNHHP